MAKIRGYKPLLTTTIMIVMLLAVLVLPAMPALAQGIPHAVMGTITCEGTPSSGASVQVTTGSGSWGFTTDGSGRYGGPITIPGAGETIQVSASKGTCDGSKSSAATQSATTININMQQPAPTTTSTPPPTPTPTTTRRTTTPPATTAPPVAQTTTPPPTTTAATTPPTTTPPTTSPPTTTPPTTFPPTPTPTTTEPPAAAAAGFDMFMILGLALLLIIAALCGVVVGHLLARRSYERVWRNTEGLIRFMRENQMIDEPKKGKGGIAPISSAKPNPTEGSGKRIRRLK